MAVIPGSVMVVVIGVVPYFLDVVLLRFVDFAYFCCRLIKIGNCRSFLV